MSWFSEIELTRSKDAFSADERVTIGVRFSLLGALREAFNEEDWTRAYDKSDVAFKLKYGVRLLTGGIRKRVLGEPVNSYRKASIFWTRNPKLVNPMKDRRIWIQVSKNFTPYVRLSEEDIRRELFDFDEEISFRASEAGSGRRRLSAEVQASWQKHDYIDAGSCKRSSGEIGFDVN